MAKQMFFKGTETESGLSPSEEARATEILEKFLSPGERLTAAECREFVAVVGPEATRQMLDYIYENSVPCDADGKVAKKSPWNGILIPQEFK